MGREGPLNQITGISLKILARFANLSDTTSKLVSSTGKAQTTRVSNRSSDFLTAVARVAENLDAMKNEAENLSKRNRKQCLSKLGTLLRTSMAS